MAVVQARGIDMIIQMFVNRGADAWSIWYGRQFLFKGIGESDLETILESIKKADTHGYYMLKVYDGIESDANIKEKTPADGSFNFTLADNPLGSDTTTQASTLSGIQKRIENKLSEKLGIMLDEADNEQKQPAKTIGEVLSRPDELKEYIEAFGMIAAIFKGERAQQSQPMQPAQVGQVHVNAGAEAAEEVQEYTEEMQQRLCAAINTLEKNDPDILLHLEKLAVISDQNKPMFNQLVKMLNALP